MKDWLALNNQIIKKDSLTLRPLSLNDQEAHRDFIDEVIKVDGKIIPMAAEITDGDRSFENWLSRTNKEAKGEEITDGRVPASVLFLFRENEDKILGAVNIRYELSEHLLKFSGNIGYGIVPSERRKGYASIMLSMALEICRKLGLRKVLITCDKNNTGSAKTIQKNGGILASEDLIDDTVRQRYWIGLTD